MLTIHAHGVQAQVRCRSVAFAGSRRGSIDPPTADRLVGSLSSLGFSFLVGCAPGIDSCFRGALTRNGPANSIVACAFKDRQQRFESPQMCAFTVVPECLSPAAALHRRTVWLVRRASLLALFPVDPLTGRWGKGSTLAFTTALYNLKPIFVATDVPPDPIPSYLVAAGSLCGLVPGYWVLPYPEEEGGAWDDEW